MSGGLDRRGPRSSRSLASRTGADVPPPPHVAVQQAVPPTVQQAGQQAGPVRHCWVVDPGGARAPGLLVEWRRAGGWEGRVAYVVEDQGEPTLVEAWVPAEQLERRSGA